MMANYAKAYIAIKRRIRVSVAYFHSLTKCAIIFGGNLSDSKIERKTVKS
jgi:hypothetical protein